MMYAYILKSVSFSEIFYAGITQDVSFRLEEHISGKSEHASKYKPWRLKTYLAFSEKSKAIAFEKYLKSGSGRALAKKRF